MANEKDPERSNAKPPSGKVSMHEGVETWEHAAMLRDLGCDVLQGYALARPMDRLELERRLRRGWKPVFGKADR